MRNTIEDKEKLADKISTEDKSLIQDALSEAEDWYKSNDDAEKSDFDEHLKDPLNLLFLLKQIHLKYLII